MIGRFKLRAFEECIVLVHLGVHLCEDSQASLLAQIALFGTQDPHGLRRSD